MTSCSNDDVTDNGPDSGKAEATGQKTWAMLNFGIGETVTRAAVVGDNGNEPGKGNDNNVNTIDLYIFDENDKLELSMTVDNTGGDAGVYDKNMLAPSTPVEVTSGKKTFCVILNKCGDIEPTKGTTTLSDFLTQQQTITNYAGLIGTEMMSSSDNLMMTGIKKDVTIHAGISKEEVTSARTSATDAEKEAKNVVTLDVNRNVAKLDLKLDGDGTSLEVKADASAPKLATLQGVTYQVNNLNKNAYYFLQEKDANEVYPTPFYTESTGDHWFNQETGGQPAGSTTPLYLTPNTHIQNNAKVGNTTYTLVKGVYVPEVGEDKYVVNGYDQVNKKFTYSTQATDLAIDKVSIFSYDYSVAFTTISALSSMDLQADANLTTAKPHLQALVAKRVAEKYSAEQDIAAGDVEFLKDKDAYTTVNKETAGSKVYAYLVPKTYNNGIANVNKPGHYTIEMKRWSKKLGETEASEDKSFNLTPLTIGVYNVVKDSDKTGLQCYYRINTFTVDFGKAHPMYYSVVRNYSYHVTINSVAQIGDTTDENVDLPGAGEQDKPIEEATTFMQCSINIYKWIGSDMSVELGK